MKEWPAFHRAREISEINKEELIDTYRDYTTASDNGECFKCEDCDGRECIEEDCEKIQKFIEKYIGKKFGEYQSKVCGQEGTAYIMPSSVIKSQFVKDEAMHNKRVEIWKSAENNGIGPIIYKDVCISMNKAINKDIYCSFIQMEYFAECDNYDKKFDKIAALIRTTAKKGFLHIDAHLQNIRCDEERAIFIDWEDCIKFEADTSATKQAFTIMLCTLINRAAEMNAFFESFEQYFKLLREQEHELEHTKAFLQLIEVEPNVEHELFLNVKYALGYKEKKTAQEIAKDSGKNSQRANELPGRPLRDMSNMN